MMICGFRGYDVGVDTPNYVYAVSVEPSYHANWGPFFYALIYVSQLFSNPETVFLFLMSVLTYLPLTFIIWKESKIPALSVLMFMIPTAMFFFETMNLARQSIAIIFILLSAVLLYKEKIKLSLCTFILAFFFHVYTVIFFPFYFIRKYTFSNNFVIATILLSIVIGLSGTLDFIKDYIDIVSMLFKDTSSSMLTKFAKYSDHNIASNFSIVGSLSHMLPLSALCILGHNHNTKNNLYYKMMVCGCIISNIFISVIYVERFASTFTIAQILAVPIIYQNSNSRTKVLIKLLLVLTAVLYFYNLYSLSLSKERWTPYHTIFE